MVAYWYWAMAAQEERQPDQSPLLRKLNANQKQALTLFAKQEEVRSVELAQHLGISPRSAAEFCIKWTEEGFLKVGNPSKKARTYMLGERFEGLFF